MLNFYANNIRFFNIIGDVFIINLLFAISFYFGKLTSSNEILLNHLLFFLYFNISWVALLAFQRTYRIYRVTRIDHVIGSILKQVFFHFLLIEAHIGITNNFADYQLTIISMYVQFAIVLPMVRLLSIKLLTLYRKSGKNVRKVVIAGIDKHALDLGAFFNHHPEFGYQLKGHFSEKTAERNSQVSFSNLKELKSFTIQHKIDEIYCSIPELGQQKVADLIEFANKHLIRIKLLPEESGFNKEKYKMDYYGTIPVLIPKALVLEDIRNSMPKRIFDVLFSSIVIVVILSWLLPILALLIKLDSKGSIIFKQRRSGYKNRDFYCLKLRTMYAHKEQGGAYKQATKGDKRITRIGAFLRSTSLDELPQFFNVLSGDMSLIGPRPHPVEMNKQYDQLIEKYMLRHSVKPGISGMSQAFGYRGETKDLSQMRNRIKMDIFYIEKWSLLLDFKIIFWTVKSILRGQNQAY